MNPIITTAIALENQRRLNANMEAMTEEEAAKFSAEYTLAVQTKVAATIEKAVYTGVSSFLDNLFGLDRKAV
jgi:hypothetical protein